MRGKPTKELAKLRQLCTSGLASEVVMPEAIKVLHGLIVSEVNACHWCDEHGNHIGFYGEDPMAWLCESRPKHLEDFEADTGLAFRHAVLFGKPTGNLRGRTSTESFEQSSSHEQVCSQLDLRWMLDGVLRDGVRPWGMVVLARKAADKDFSAADEATLASTLPYLLHAMKATGTDVSGYADSGRSGMLLCRADGTLLESSDRARELVLMARSNGSAASGDAMVWDDPAVTRWLTDMTGSLAVRLADSHQAPHPPVQTVRNRWGEFDLRAYRLEGKCAVDTRMGVLVEHRIPLEMEILRNIIDGPLSVRQKEVCWLVARGIDNTRIARQLGLSYATLKEYLQGIYSRLGVSGREELVRVLLLPGTGRTGRQPAHPPPA